MPVEKPQKRTKQIIFKVNAAEDGLLRRGSALARRKRSPWMRGLLLDEAKRLVVAQGAAPTNEETSGGAA
jgi:hypothetical protein